MEYEIIMAYKSQVTNKYMGSTFKGAPRSNRNPQSTELGQIVSVLKNDLTPARIPPNILRFLLSFEKLVNIFADVIASFDKATAVGPENKSNKSLHLVFSRASFVILFFVILKTIPCSLILALRSSN